MGKFSAELDAIMATRDVALAGVIRDTGISRAAFFKYRNGSRLPSDIKTVERLADVLQLNFDERRRFREGYLIDQIGEYKYRGMMAIEKLLCTPAGFLCAGNAEKAVSGENSDEDTGTALSGMLPVTMKIMSVMRDGLRKGDVTVFETISSDSMFRVIGQVKGSIHEHELTHIMAMNGSDNASAEDRLYNVERLGSIIRTLCSSEGYRPYYYYASLSTLRTLGILTTNFILTRDTVLCYAEDYSSAVVLREPENVALYGNIAAGVMRIASPYAEKKSLADGIKTYNMFNCSSEMRYSFIPGMCLTSVIKDTDDLLVKNVRHDIEGMDSFLAGYKDYAVNLQTSIAQNKGKYHYVVSGPGLRHTSETGTINEFPRDATIPLDREGTFKLMRRFRRLSAAYDFRVMDDDRLPPDNTIGVEAVPGLAIISLILPGEFAMRVIVIREQSTAALIYDYLSMAYENRTLTGEEREKWYDRLLEEGGER